MFESLLFQNWQPFYTFTGTAAATLAGLLFVGLTFGVGVIHGDINQAVRIWAEPTFHDFLQIIIISGLALFPNVSTAAFGLVLLVHDAIRIQGLWHVTMEFKRDAKRYEFEFMDWVEYVGLPAASYLLLALCGLGLLLGWHWAVAGIGVYVLTILVLAVRSSWTQVVWMFVEKHKEPAGKG